MGNAERETKSPGAGLFRAKKSGEIAARRRKAGCCLKGLTLFVRPNEKTESLLQRTAVPGLVVIEPSAIPHRLSEDCLQSTVGVRVPVCLVENATQM